jgi:rod shape-determining protein MreC
LSPIQDQDHRPLLLAGPSLGLRLAVLGVLSLVIMVADHRGGYLAAFRGALTAAAYPVQRAVDAPFAAWESLGGEMRSRAEIQADNVELAAENLKLKLRLMRYDALEQENLRLRAAREGSSRVVQRSLVAEIMKVDLDPFRQRVLVNKGAREGVYRGQAALDANGVFGQVRRVGPVSAEVIMVSDPEHAIPVAVNRTGVRTIAVGTGRPDRLSLPYLPRNADLEAGDLIVTSGLGGVFPPGYPVARVAEVKRDPGQPLLEVLAEPLAALDRDPEVLLVWFERAIVEPEPAAEAAPAAAPPPAATGATAQQSPPAAVTAAEPAAPAPPAAANEGAAAPPAAAAPETAAPTPAPEGAEATAPAAPSPSPSPSPAEDL